MACPDGCHPWGLGAQIVTRVAGPEATPKVAVRFAKPIAAIAPRTHLADVHADAQPQVGVQLPWVPAASSQVAGDVRSSTRERAEAFTQPPGRSDSVSRRDDPKSG